MAIEDACVPPDPRGTLPGRGAYVHPTLVCLDQAVRRRAFTRALRAPPGALDTKALRRYVERTTVAEQALGRKTYRTEPPRAVWYLASRKQVEIAMSTR